MSDISAINRKSQTLNNTNFQRMLFTKLFGIAPDDTDVICNEVSHIREVNNKYLLQPDNDASSARLYAKTDEMLSELDRKIMASETKGLTMDSFKLVTDVVGDSSVYAYYGQTLLDLNPHTMDDVTTWVGKGRWPLIFSAPRFFAPPAWATRPSLDARDRLITSLKGLLKAMALDENVASPFLQERARLEGSLALRDDTIAKNFLGILFG